MPILSLAVGACEIVRAVHTHEIVRMPFDEAVPFGEPGTSDVVGRALFERDRGMKDVDTGAAQLREIAVSESGGRLVPSIEQRPVQSEQAQHVDDIRLLDQIDRARGIWARSQRDTGEKGCYTERQRVGAEVLVDAKKLQAAKICQTSGLLVSMTAGIGFRQQAIAFFYISALGSSAQHPAAECLHRGFRQSAHSQGRSAWQTLAVTADLPPGESLRCRRTKRSWGRCTDCRSRIRI